MNGLTSVKPVLTVLLLALVLTACAGSNAFMRGQGLIENGQIEEGLAQLRAASAANPNNAEYRKQYQQARDQYVNQILIESDKARMLGRYEDAAGGFARALDLDPDSTRAQIGLQAVAAEEIHRRDVAEAKLLFDSGESEEALAKVKAVLNENPSQKDAQALQREIETEQVKEVSSTPTLADIYKKPVTLEFRDAPLKSVFEVLAKASGINFIFDRDVRPDLRTTIFVRDTSIEDAVNFLLVTSQLEKKILNHNTVLVYPDLPNKNKSYQELVVKSFYLGNADVKQTLNLIKTLVKTRDVFVDERLNLLVMRDTPEAIALATKLIATQDLAEPEVILEVEVLEVGQSKLQELGLRYPNRLSYGVQGAASVPGNFSLTEWLNSNNRSEFVQVDVTDPGFVIDLRRQDGRTNILASPRIRVKNREKAKVHIGDRLPVITTTSTANVGVSESVQYLDIGLKFDVESNVYLNDEVGMKVSLEVSNIVQEIRSQNGTLTYRIGTRNTETTLRVANGETQVLAGLIQEEDRRSAEKVPGLSDLPLIGRLFTSNNDTQSKTEIVLLITPYIVRGIDRPGPAALEFASGTEGSVGASSLQLRSGNSSSSSQSEIPTRVPGGTANAARSSDIGSEPIATTTETVDSMEETLRRQAASLWLSAPLQVQAGREFGIAISVLPGAPASPIQLLVNYDDGLLEAIGVSSGSKGLIPVTLTGTATLRFRAREGADGSATIAIEDILTSGSDEGTLLTAPSPVQVKIVQ